MPRVACMAPKPRRTSEDEIRRRWAALDGERRQALMRFDDPMLVERIKASLQALFEKQMLMLHLGISLGSSDPFAASALFTSAFEFTWQICRSARNPSVVLVDPSGMPVLVMKPSFLEVQGDTVIETLRAVLPDMLSEKSGRVPMFRARWKDLWAAEPASIQAMEQQLVKLVEQALWAMGADPSCELLEDSNKAAVTRPLALSDEVPLEPWMLDGAEPRGKAAEGKKKKKGKKPVHTAGGGREEFSEDPPPTSQPASISEEQEEDDNVDSDQLDEDLEDSGSAQAGAAVSLEHLPASPMEELGGEAGLQDAMSDSEVVADVSDRICLGDEGVGVGTFNLAGNAALGVGLSLDPTASSTPAADSRSWGRSSPTASHKLMHPPQLVCYIWNQTSQFVHGSEWPRHTGAPAVGSCTTPLSVDTATPRHPSTPFSRGQWMDPSQPGSPNYTGRSPIVSAVVKNTFVDIIDDPSECPKAVASRTSRSLSPPHSYGFSDDGWADHWHT